MFRLHSAVLKNATSPRPSPERPRRGLGEGEVFHALWCAKHIATVLKTRPLDPYARVESVLALFVIVCLAGFAQPADAAVRRDRVAGRIRTTDGVYLEGEIESGPISVEVDGKTRDVGLGEILTVQLGSAASATEAPRIAADLVAIAANTDRAARESAVAELSDIGLPVLSPLLATYKDTDLHEPNPLYRLFARIVPGYADRADRTLDMVRLSNGETLRGRLSGADFRVVTAERRGTVVRFSSLRSLAVRRKSVDKTFEVQALRHCSQIEFLDSGVCVTTTSAVEETAVGFVRLSFDIDGWSSDPDGIKTPGPHYMTIMVEGFPFGALIARIGPAGPRWLAGRHQQKSSKSNGRLYFAVNDNGHWQNNIGSFRVHLRVSDAYDLGDAQ